MGPHPCCAQGQGHRLHGTGSCDDAKIATPAGKMARSPSCFHTVVPRRACIQGVLMVKVMWHGHFFISEKILVVHMVSCKLWRYLRFCSTFCNMQWPTIYIILWLYFSVNILRKLLLTCKWTIHHQTYMVLGQDCIQNHNQGYKSREFIIFAEWATPSLMVW